MTSVAYYGPDHVEYKCWAKFYVAESELSDKISSGTANKLEDTNPIFIFPTIHFQQLQFIYTYMIWLLLLLQTANDIRQLAFKGQKASTIIYNHKRPFRREPDH